jgi:hypothetical protein
LKSRRKVILALCSFKKQSMPKFYNVLSVKIFLHLMLLHYNISTDLQYNVKTFLCLRIRFHCPFFMELSVGRSPFVLYCRTWVTRRIF